jgi:hypothetical protein
MRAEKPNCGIYSIYNRDQYVIHRHCPSLFVCGDQRAVVAAYAG